MFVLLFILKIFFSTIEFFSAVILSLTLFRIPYRFLYTKTFVVSIIMAIIEVYFREIIGNDYALLPVVFAEVIMIMLIFQIPILYSLLICIIGYLTGFLVETFFIIIGSAVGITSQFLIGTSVLHLFGLELCTSLFVFLVVWYLHNRKIGFQFMSKHLSLKQSLKGYNFLLSAVLLLGTIGMQLQLLTFDKHDLKIYIEIVLSIIFLVSIFVAYVYNKKQIKQKYERLTNHERNR